tara:strand:+ start:533 stop:1153 length:621 start_codon:yes stop_codon:yes gene_type:complete
MTYFLGRDMDVYITTESAFGLHFKASDYSVSTAVTPPANNITFAMPLASGVVTSTAEYAFGDLVVDLTGCDLSIGSVDEDVTYFGLRSVGKVESKKETTVSLTRKKVDAMWDKIFNDGYRWGISGSSDPWDGLEEPTATHGYRLHCQLKSGTEVYTVPNACIQSHTVSLNADGTADETMEFMSYVTPLLGTSAAAGSDAVAVTTDF